MADLGTATITHPGSDRGAPRRRPPRQRKGGWFRRVGWRHIVGMLALAFSLFPIVFVVSSALNPLGTLSSSELIPTGTSLENFTQAVRHLLPDWFLNSMFIGAAVGRAVHVHLRLRGVRVLPVPVRRPAHRAADRPAGADVPAVPGHRRALPDVREHHRPVAADRVQHPLGPAAALPRRRPRREHLADEGLLRHHPQGPRRVGQGGRGHPRPDLLRPHPAAGRADPGGHRRCSASSARSTSS